MRELELKEFMVKRGGSINPAKHPDETFELLSIPAFDKKKPEIVTGSEIGSSKKCVEPNDILLSKIVPHIRRCWVVPEKSNHRQIASGEWIQFRSSNVEPKYLKYFLTSDQFHQRFMGTVSGVGGSLLRASPSQVERLKIPLPPLPEQKHIAAILDAADALRQKDQQLIDHYTTLGQSLFLEMFGDPAENPKKFPKKRLEHAFHHGKEATKCGPFGSALKKHEYTESGVPVWVMDNIKQPYFDPNNSLFISPEKFEKLKSYSTIPDDIIISRAGTVGKMCIIPESVDASIISTNLIRLRFNQNIVIPIFFVRLMNDFLSRVGRLRTGPDGSFTHMNTGILRDLVIPIPPVELQREFAHGLNKLEEQKLKLIEQKNKADALFNCLLQRAFKGELTTSKAA